MLTAEQREEIRALIKSLIGELEASVASLHEQTTAEANDEGACQITRMDNLMNKGTAELAMQESQKRLTRLREKLERIDEPDFGKCASCGKWISIERLRAAPERGVCVECLRKK